MTAPVEGLALQGMPTYVAWQVTEVLDEGQPIPDHAVQFAKHLMSTTHESVLERVGFEHTLIDTVEGGGPEIVVPPWAVQQFAAIGTPAELIERIAAAHAAGADSWSCSFTGTPQETAASMTRFAEQVMKPLRSHMAA